MSPHLLQYQAQSPDEQPFKSSTWLGICFHGSRSRLFEFEHFGRTWKGTNFECHWIQQHRKKNVRYHQKIKWTNLVNFKESRFSHLRTFATIKNDWRWMWKVKWRRIPLKELREINLKHLDKFAESGLRTLCFASRQLSEEEYETFAFRHAEASTYDKSRINDGHRGRKNMKENWSCLHGHWKIVYRTNCPWYNYESSNGRN